ncbi:uncharacterized protein LOC123534429 isoform X1 [Mercenaria mercenaria]|uniref:uncharacterized protein LOC123534429 isoform X1 n=1 Tax=Mercenaria mercenaria TaxID=6596 RepID=UPI00234FB566|nr:uncharacterized protein LOC123534429 isoform X1 [Mercenaria mercenaria]
MEKSLQLFNVQHVHPPAHIVCDIPFWRAQFKALASANLAHNQSLCKIIGRTQSYMESIATTTDTRCQDEETLIANLMTVQNGLKYQATKLKADAEVYQELERSLKQHKMKAHEQKLAQYSQQLKNRREKLDKQNKIIEEHKTAYHKVMFQIERGRIKSKLATKPDVVYRTEGKLNALKTKADRLYHKYVKQLEKWQRKFENMEKISSEYEDVFTDLQSERADIVLSALRECVTQTDAGIIGDKNRIFKGIDGANIIKTKVLQREEILAPQFEAFEPSGNTTEMYAQARAEIEAEERCSYSSDSDFDVSDVEFKQDLRVNRHMKTARKSRTYVVTENYRRENIDELNLNIGDQVTKLLPANDRGMAYGEVTRNNMLHKKKKGFFPESHVGHIDEIQANIDNNVRATDDSEKSSRNKFQIGVMNALKPNRKTKLTESKQKITTDELEKKRRPRKFFSSGNLLRKWGKKEGKGTEIELLPGAFRLMMENGGSGQLARELQPGESEFSRRNHAQENDVRVDQEQPHDLIIEEVDVDNTFVRFIQMGCEMEAKRPDESLAAADDIEVNLCEERRKIRKRKGKKS